MAEKNTVVLEDTVTFEIPVGFKDEDGFIHKEVEIREINGYVEESISKAEIRGNSGKLITTLLASVTVRIGDVTLKSIGSASKWEKIFRELPMGDRDKIMLEIRKFSNGDELELDLKCPSCKGDIKHIVELGIDVEEKPLEVDASSIPFQLPKGIRNRENILCNVGILRLPDGIDQEQLDTIGRKNPGMANTTLLSRTIVNIDGFGKVGLTDIRKMVTKDREYLIRLLGESMYGPKFEISFPCPHCGEDIETGVHPINFL